MLQSLLAALVRAQREHGLSNRRVAEMIGVTASAITHYLQGNSVPSFDVLARWAGAVGLAIGVQAPHAAAVESLAEVAEDLTAAELEAVHRVALALLASRGVPTTRAVVVAAISMAAQHAQVSTPLTLASGH